MSRPAIFRIKLGVRVPIVLGAISNLALAEVLSMFVCVLRCFTLCFGGKKDICGEEEILLFDHGKVRASSDRRHKPPLRPLLVGLAWYTEMR